MDGFWLIVVLFLAAVLGAPALGLMALRTARDHRVSRPVDSRAEDKKYGPTLALVLYQVAVGGAARWAQVGFAAWLAFALLGAGLLWFVIYVWLGGHTRDDDYAGNYRV